MNITSAIPNSIVPGDRQAMDAASRDVGEFAPFASILTGQMRAQHDGSTDAELARQAEAKQAANQLVSSTFIIPILSKLRETSWAEGPFAPGAAEKRFGPLLDEHLADRIIEASNFDIVDAIAERYARIGGAAAVADKPPFERFERIG